MLSYNEMESSKAAIVLIALSLIFFTRLASDTFNLPRMWLCSLSCLIGSWSIRKTSNMADVIWSIFAIAFLLSTWFSVDKLMSICGLYYSGWENLLLVGMAWTCFEVGTSLRNEDMCSGISLAGVIGALYILCQRSGLDPLAWNPDFSGRMSGLMGHPAWSGCMLAIAIPCILRLHARKPIRGIFESEEGKSFFIFTLPLIAAALLFTGSRGAMLSASAAVAWYYRDMVKSKYLWSGLLGAALLILLIKHGVSDKMRIDQNIVAINAWWRYPFLGWGPATGALWFLSSRTADTFHGLDLPTTIQLHSHNLFTNIMASQGIIGLISWAMISISAWRIASSSTKGMMIAAFIFGMFNPIPSVAYLAVALSCGSDINGPLVTEQTHSHRRFWVTPIVAFICLWSYSGKMLADMECRIGVAEEKSGFNTAAIAHYMIAAEQSSSEFYYPARAALLTKGQSPALMNVVSAACMKSLARHSNNPMAFMGAIEALRSSGNNEAADKLSILAGSLDPMRHLKRIR